MVKRKHNARVAANNHTTGNDDDDDDDDNNDHDQFHMEDEPFIVQEMQSSYRELVQLIAHLPMVKQEFPATAPDTTASAFCSSSSSSSLPQELIRKIASYFIIERVTHSQVQAIQASSTAGRFPLQEVLRDDDTTWWISSTGSMPKGRGHEYVQFRLGPVLRRLSAISIKIPPLPLGPLSVRTIRLDVLLEEGATSSSLDMVPHHEEQQQWKTVSTPSHWTVENKTGYQKFELHPPIDAKVIRIVCLTNQMSRFLQNYDDAEEDEEEEEEEGMGRNRHRVLHQFESVGFYSVLFE